MDISLEKPGAEWYDIFPARGGVYDLAYAARFGENGTDRLRAVVALGKSGDPRAVRPLADLLTDSDREIRLSATIALGELKSGRAVEALTLRLGDRNESVSVREQAAVSLGSIRSTGAIRILKEFIADESEDRELRLVTEKVLAIAKSG